VNVTSTGWLYQPFASGPRDAEPETLGPLASYRNETDWDAEWLPALSVQLPETEADEESGPL
jgi:hypothetical protein